MHKDANLKGFSMFNLDVSCKMTTIDRESQYTDMFKK